MATEKSKSVRAAQSKTARAKTLPAEALRCRRKFLRYFPGGFRDETYIDWERNYKWAAHEQWKEGLNQETYRALLRDGAYEEIAARAVRLESRTNLLFSFEKMAVRDAIKPAAGARLFAEGLYDFIYGEDSLQRKFERWCEVVGALPRRQTRVLTWPVVTVFGFIAEPRWHVFLKPNVTRTAARAYAWDFHYQSKPSWETYAGLLEFANAVCRDVRDLKPHDMIDIQSFIWVQGSDEYP